MSATPPPADDSMGERAASAVGLDIDWSTVDPAARASMEMALAMGANFDGPLAQRAAAAQAQEAADGRAAAHEAAMAATGRDWDSELRRLEAELAEADAAAGERDDASDEHESPDASAGPAKGTTAPDDAGSTACGVDDDGDDHEGMGAPAGTAEASWGGDDADWVLARIVRRRKHRGPVGSFDPDVEAEDMRWEYLCAWEGHGEATWERRAWLQDYGLGDRVAAFDAERAPAGPSSTKKLRPKKPNRSEQVKQQAKLRAAMSAFDGACDGYRKLNDLAVRVAKTAETLNPQWHELMSMFFHNSAGSTDSPFDVSTATLLPRLQSSKQFQGVKVCDAVGLSTFLLTILSAVANEPGYCLTTVTPIAPNTLAALHDYAHRSRARLRVVFHGTRAEAVAPIVEKGLLVPRPEINGVSVANGSAYGIGVYSAESLSTPVNFSRGSNNVFACLAIASGSGVNSPGNGFHIFGEDHLIVPMLKMSVGSSASSYGNHGCGAEFKEGLLQHFMDPNVRKL
jgi:hypothetical protein